MQNYTELSEIIKAIGHPIRLEIVEILREEGEACVCHLEHRTGHRQAYISQHLSRLREAGLVRDRREGMNVFYALSVDRVGALIDAANEILGASNGHQSRSEPVQYHSLMSQSGCACPKCQAKQRGEMVAHTGTIAPDGAK